jgi:putative copper export protein
MLVKKTKYGWLLLFGKILLFIFRLIMAAIGLHDMSIVKHSPRQSLKDLGNLPGLS